MTVTNTTQPLLTYINSYTGYATIPFQKPAEPQSIKSGRGVSRNSNNDSEIRKAVSDRLLYLDEVFDEEEHIEKYRVTKRILIDLFESVTLRKAPYIGVDDNGQIEAFWYEGKDYNIISLIPASEKKIIVTCLKDSGTAITMITSLENIKRSHGQELSMPWKEIIV